MYFRWNFLTGSPYLYPRNHTIEIAHSRINTEASGFLKETVQYLLLVSRDQDGKNFLYILGCFLALLKPFLSKVSRFSRDRSYSDPKRLLQNSSCNTSLYLFSGIRPLCNPLVTSANVLPRLPTILICSFSLKCCETSSSVRRAYPRSRSSRGIKPVR